MPVSNPEASKRLKIAQDLVERVRLLSDGVLVAGSVAYGPNTAVTKESDVDLIILTEQFSELTRILGPENAVKVLRTRYFDGVSLKLLHEDVPVSIHLMNADAMDVIAKSFVADIRVLRPMGKSGSYTLRGFEGQEYHYSIKNIPLPESAGYFRTKVPVSFIYQDRYYIGIHRDKLLSHPVVLHDPSHSLEKRIEKTWSMAATFLIDESYRLLGCMDLTRLNIANALCKFDHMDEEARLDIAEKTKLYVDEAIKKKGL